jgi:hypothetical protein
MNIKNSHGFSQIFTDYIITVLEINKIIEIYINRLILIRL